ncbi:hypothetical protein Pth03_33190 [Planotetraspora thailandica]|uniref:Uncharacterized protein n=1 Tax=Planotetraspora thailandica TaxID=487172 RepID=A0A8J3VCL7_9ACTN|nr:hypothetical protein [Planotetraspora thailandica]GII54930.1 hypothetical protein Pth03_33190 [Planotetraspora thailandica]
MLSDACGSAEHVPALLDRFGDDPSGVWSELMDHLCPQLDQAFSASYAALPRLAELASGCAPDDRVWVLQAAGAIMACAHTGDDVFKVYADSIADLHRLTDQCLGEIRDRYVYLLQSLLSFEGVEVWDRCLEGLLTGEYEVACPSCGVNVFIVIGEGGCFSASDDYASRQVERVALLPVGTGELDGLGERLQERTRADGQMALAGGLPYLFGRAVCPDCRTHFSVADQLARNWMPM